MRTVFLLFLAILPTFLFSFSGAALREKIAKPIPEWMQKQIDADLKPFLKEGASKRCIDETVSAVHAMPRGEAAQFVKIAICNNRMSASSLTQDLQDARLVHLMGFFQEMARHISFPDCEFLFSLWDDFDSPLFLHACKGAVFVICKKKTNSYAILLPEVRNYEYYEGARNALLSSQNAHPWEKRAQTAYWRGNTTGGYYHYYEWDRKPRPQLVLFSKAHPELLDARFTGTYYLENYLEETFKGLDFFAPWQYLTEQLRYRYLVAIDGNSFPSSLKWQLLSGSVVLKNDSEYIEWFHNALKPYVHFVPFRIDCSDFAERLHWLKEHDAEARIIAQNAVQFAMENLTLEDFALYYYHLLSAFARLQEMQE